jgi:hypothetical protein
MPIDATCEYWNNNRWNGNFKGSVASTKDKGDHAEVKAYTASTSGQIAQIYRITQNAFPCQACTIYFLNKSLEGKSFIFHCTSNDGLYARECGFMARPFMRDPNNNSKTEADINGFLYIKSGMLYAKRKSIEVANLTAKSVKITTTGMTTGDTRPPDLVSKPGGE